MKKTIFMLLGGIESILVGSLYILHAFGPTEAEVVDWGEVSVYVGAILVILSVVIGRSKNKIAKAVLATGYVVLALLQVLPIILWITFSGNGISDGSPPSDFVAHWGYALLHLTLVIASVAVLYYITRDLVRLRILEQRTQSQ